MSRYYYWLIINFFRKLCAQSSTSLTSYLSHKQTTSKILDERVEFITVEDYDYWLQLALSNANFEFIRSFEGEYLVHGGNSSGIVELHKRNERNLLKHHVFNIQKFDSNREKLWRNMRAILFFREAFRQLNSRHFRLFPELYVFHVRFDSGT